MEAAADVSIPLIAVVVLLQAFLQVVLPFVRGDTKAATPTPAPHPPPSSGGNGTKAVMAHQITEIDQRTEAMTGELTSLSGAVADLARCVRANTSATQQLTERINDTQP